MWRSLHSPAQWRIPGPWLEVPEARLLEPWQCQLYQEEKLLGAAVYTAEPSMPGLNPITELISSPSRPLPWPPSWLLFVLFGSQGP